MGYEGALKILSTPAINNNSTWCYVYQDGVSSGSVLTEIKEELGKTLQIHQVKNGVLLELQTKELEKQQGIDCTNERKSNRVMYSLDTMLIDYLTSFVRNTGINKVATRLAKATELNGEICVYCLLVSLMVQQGFCNYSATVVERLKTLLASNSVVNNAIYSCIRFYDSGVSSDTVFRAISYMLQNKHWVITDEGCNFAYSKMLSMCIKVPETAKANKTELLSWYIKYMLDRRLFKAIYLIGNTVSYRVGLYLNTNNHGGNAVAYKLSLNDVVECDKAKNSIIQSSFAVKINDITSFVEEELLKGAEIVRDGEYLLFTRINGG